MILLKSGELRYASVGKRGFTKKNPVFLMGRSDEMSKPDQRIMYVVLNYTARTLHSVAHIGWCAVQNFIFCKFAMAKAAKFCISFNRKNMFEGFICAMSDFQSISSFC